MRHCRSTPGRRACRQITHDHREEVRSCLKLQSDVLESISGRSLNHALPAATGRFPH